MAFENNYRTGPFNSNDDNSGRFLAPQGPNIITTGVEANEVSFSKQLGYQIPIAESVALYAPADFPMLSKLLADSFTNGPSLNAPFFNIGEGNEGDNTVESMFHYLALRDTNGYAIGNANEIGGKVIWRNIEDSDITTYGVKDIGSYDELTIAALGSGDVEQQLSVNGSSQYTLLGLYVDPTDTIIGNRSSVVNKLLSLCENNTYVKRDEVTYTIDSVAKTGISFKYTSGISKAVYYLLEDIVFQAATIKSRKTGAKIRLESCFISTANDIIMVFELADSNIDDLLDNKANDTNYVSLEQVVTGNGSVFNSSAIDGGTCFSPYWMINQFTDVPDGYAEGTNFNRGGGYTYDVSIKQNFAQIFKSDAYGVTGTRLATKVRFYDDIAMSRKRYLSQYKTRLGNAFLWGKKSNQMVDGKNKRTCSGIFDRELFPIRYMRQTLPSIGLSSGSDSAYPGDAMDDFIEELMYNLNFASEGNKGDRSFMVSREVIRHFDKYYNRVAGDTGAYGGLVHRQSMFGGSAVKNPALNQRSMIVFDTRFGKATFIWDKTFDFQTDFKVPYYLFNTKVNPRFLMVALDMSQIAVRTLRSDKIMGNIQSPGQDMYEEAMLGEHSIQLLRPNRHAMIYLK